VAELSVLIPARNELFLSRTVQDVLEHAQADTEVIVVLDGAWPEQGYELAQHLKVQVIYLPEPIGQRAATNLAARVSTAKYIMKLDAHCSLADGFDRVLIEAAAELGPDVTQIPAQKNLHVHQWRCEKCGTETYQCPIPTDCETCQATKRERGGPFTRVMVWKPRSGTTTTCWTFNAEPRFQYGGTDKREIVNGIGDVMSSLGACFFMARERFWQLSGLDEAHGSWGSLGIEVACKSWLSGGRQVVNTRTWFAHFFRVGGINFPYPIKGSDQDKARKYSHDLWFTNAWDGQVLPLRWLVDKFWSVSGWSEEQRDALPPLRAPAVKRSATAGVVYYTDNRCPEPIASAVREQLERVAPGPIVAVSLKPLDWPAAKNIVLPLERSILSMFRQILAGLEALDTDYVFLAEHDVVYSADHMQFVPSRDDAYFYDAHVWKVCAETGRVLHYPCNQTSGLCANRRLLIEHYRKRVAHVEQHGYRRNNGFEPGTRSTRHGGFDDVPFETWMATVPNVDIRHSECLTPSRWRKDQFRNQKYTEGWTEADAIPGWKGQTLGRFDDWLAANCPSLVHAAV
jgi:hypothetical protein